MACGIDVLNGMQKLFTERLFTFYKNSPERQSTHQADYYIMTIDIL